MTAQLIALFAFGLVMTGVVYLGVIRAREISDRVARVQAASQTRDEPTNPNVLQNHNWRKVS